MRSDADLATAYADCKASKSSLVDLYNQFRQNELDFKDSLAKEAIP